MNSQPYEDELTGQKMASARITIPVEHAPAPQRFKHLPAGVERHLRLDLRVLLNQGNGTWEMTNAIADELAMHILRNFKVEEK